MLLLVFAQASGVTICLPISVMGSIRYAGACRSSLQGATRLSGSNPRFESTQQFETHLLKAMHNHPNENVSEDKCAQPNPGDDERSHDDVLCSHNTSQKASEQTYGCAETDRVVVHAQVIDSLLNSLAGPTHP